MNKIWLSTVLAVTASASWAAKPVAGNVSVQQDADGKIIVSYDLTADADAPEPGIVTVSFACGDTPINARHYTYVWGDVNRKIACGIGKKIYWHATRDWRGHAAADDGALTASVNVWATNAPPLYMDLNLLDAKAVSYYASEEAVPFGIRSDIYKTDRLLMRRIPAKGVVFRMGSPAAEAGRNNTYENTFYTSFSSDYYLGVYPLTQRQVYNLGVLSGLTAPSDLTPSRITAAYGYGDDVRRPADSISYNKLRGEDNSAQTTADEAYLWPQMGHAVSPTSLLGRWRAATGIAFDLPTEAQWEFACRAGQPGPLNVDGATLDEVAWHPGNSAVGGKRQTHPVGLKRPNAWGLYDMHGNVLEWCLDRVAKYPTAPDPKAPYVDYHGPDAATSNNGRARRGGSFGHVNSDGVEIGFDCRSAARWSTYSVMCIDQNLGVRLCCPAGDLAD